MTVENFETENQDNLPVKQSIEESAPDEMQIPMYNKKQVSDIVKREREKAIEKGKREALMQMQEEQQANQQQPAQQIQQASQGLGGMPSQMDPNQLKQMLAEQIPHALQEHVATMKNEQFVNSFVNKMQAAEARFPGLEAKLNSLDYSTIAPLLQMANEMENTGDIMHEIIENPMKMGNLLSLMYAQPQLAQKAMGDLSNSIKQNQEAKAQEAQANDPMSQIKSSSSAGMDNGQMSVKDFRKMFKV